PHTQSGGLGALNEREKQTVFECLRAASDGPFFPDWEFPILFGLERAQVRAIAAAAPQIDDSHEDTELAIHNAMGQLLGYPHQQESAWSGYISASHQEVSRVFDKWRGDAAI